MVLLYLDLLGMKTRWQAGGVAAAKAAYHTLDLVIRHAFEAAPSRLAASATGGVQSDAAALAFPDAAAAITIGRLIFRESFRRSDAHERFWLRGVILELTDTELETEEMLPGAARQISKRVFSDELLEAINVEQSGYRGQRLLIQEVLIDSELEKRFRIPVGDSYFYPLAPLHHCVAVPGFRDVLWMFPDDATDWERTMVAMGNRLRWAGEGSSGEFLQAAATQLAFQECQAIYANLPASQPD